MIKLPSEQRKPFDNIHRFGKIPDDKVWVFYGPPKTGKTTCASSFPKALIIECDPGGADEIQSEYPPLKPKNIEDVRAYIPLIRDSKLFRTVVIDTVDTLGRWLEDDICRKNSVEFIADIDYGKGRNELNSRLTRIIDNYRRACMGDKEKGIPPKNLILILHSRAERGKSLILTDVLEMWIKGQASIIGYCFKTSKNGRMQHFIDPSGSGSDAGSRNPYLANCGPIENTYQAFSKGFDEYKTMLEMLIGEKGVVKFFESEGISPQQFEEWLRHRSILNYGKDELMWINKVKIDIIKELQKNKRTKLDAIINEIEGYGR